MSNARTITLAAALATFTTPPCLAAESAEMHVSGQVSAQNTCSLSLADNGSIAYGDVPTSALSRTFPTELPVKGLSVSISCAAPTRFALSMLDNRAGTEARTGNFRFGLGATSTFAKAIGDVTFSISSVTFEGGSGRAILSNGSLNGTYAIAPFQNFNKRNAANATYFSVVGPSGPTNTPVPVTTATMVIAVGATIAPLDQVMPLSGPQAIDGNALVEINYL